MRGGRAFGPLLLVAAVACSSHCGGAEHPAMDDETPPPPDFHADVDPWPPPHPSELRLVLEASRDRITDRPEGGPLADGPHPGLFAREGRVGRFDYLEVIFGEIEDPDAELPLVVMLHGRGDRPRIPGLPLETLPSAIRVFIPRAPDRLGDGYTWLATYTQSHEEHLIARSLSATSDHLAAAIVAFTEQVPTRGKPIVVGFSQGGILTWALACRHPQHFAAAFPVAGYLPESLRPEEPSPQMPIIHALHGDADPTVPITYDRRSVAFMRALGAEVYFSVAPGVEHRVNRAMNHTVRGWIRGALFPNRFPDDVRREHEQTPVTESP